METYIRTSDEAQQQERLARRAAADLVADAIANGDCPREKRAEWIASETKRLLRKWDREQLGFCSYPAAGFTTTK